jgi:hypothetical protein
MYVVDLKKAAIMTEYKNGPSPHANLYLWAEYKENRWA